MSLKNVFNALSTLLFIIVLISAFAAVLPVYSGTGRFLTVLSGSMSPEISAGDMVAVKKVNPQDIREGDIISYRRGREYVTHRVVGIASENSRISFMTKGDANDDKDAETIASENLVGKVVFTVPKAGYMVQYVRSPPGFVIFIIIPAALIIMRHIIKILKHLKVGQDERLY